MKSIFTKPSKKKSRVDGADLEAIEFSASAERVAASFMDRNAVRPKLKGRRSDR